MDEIIDINTLFGPLAGAATDLSVDDLGVMMTRNGIRACMTLSTVGLVLDHAMGNAATRAACADNSNLIPAATINPLTMFAQGGFGNLAADGFRLVRFFPSLQGWPADFAPFRALLQELAAQKLPLMVDVDHPGTATHLMSVAGDYPGPVILGGIQGNCMSEAAALMRAHANLYVETSRLVAAGAIKHIVEMVGADRVLYGSGAPSRPMASGMNLLRHSGLTEIQRAMVLAGNATKLFNIRTEA